MQAKVLVHQLHHVLRERKLDFPGNVLHLSSDVASTYYFLGYLNKKDLLHVVIDMTEFTHDSDAGALHVRLKPHVDSGTCLVVTKTLHQVFHELLGAGVVESAQSRFEMKVWEATCVEAMVDSELGNCFRFTSSCRVAHVLGEHFVTLSAASAASVPEPEGNEPWHHTSPVFGPPSA